jgi:hypothetical protein
MSKTLTTLENGNSGNRVLALVITDFNCCPHCGSDYGYYKKVRSKGSWNDTTFFDHKSKENTEMLDWFHNTWESEWYYCSECRKQICKQAGNNAFT